MHVFFSVYFWNIFVLHFRITQWAKEANPGCCQSPNDETKFFTLVDLTPHWLPVKQAVWEPQLPYSLEAVDRPDCEDEEKNGKDNDCDKEDEDSE